MIRITHMGKPHPRRILAPLGTSVSDREQRAAFLAVLAQCFHAQVTLFHRSVQPGGAAPADSTAMRTALHCHHVPVLERSGTGPIAKAIALEAVSHHNDLVVIGASARGMLRRMIFGNPAGDVMHQPPCNVILFRAAPALP